MLNEKVTVTICGKAYNLRTDNASSLIRQGEEADRRITEYCREMSLSKDDACVFTVLDLLGDLDSANAQRDSYAKKNAALVSTAEKGAKALEETSSSPPKTSCSQRTAPPSRSYAGNTPSLKAKTPSSPKRSAKPTSAPSRTPAQRRSLKSPSRP